MPLSNPNNPVKALKGKSSEELNNMDSETIENISNQIEAAIIEKINELRTEYNDRMDYDIGPVSGEDNKHLRQTAAKNNAEVGLIGGHADGSLSSRVRKNVNDPEKQNELGELAENNHVGDLYSVQRFAENTVNGWKNSQDHLEYMIAPGAEKVGVSVTPALEDGRLKGIVTLVVESEGKDHDLFPDGQLIFQKQVEALKEQEKEQKQAKDTKGKPDREKNSDSKEAESKKKDTKPKHKPKINLRNISSKKTSGHTNRRLGGKPRERNKAALGDLMGKLDDMGLDDMDLSSIKSIEDCQPKTPKSDSSPSVRIKSGPGIGNP